MPAPRNCPHCGEPLPDSEDAYWFTDDFDDDELGLDPETEETDEEG